MKVERFTSFLLKKLIISIPKLRKHNKIDNIGQKNGFQVSAKTTTLNSRHNFKLKLVIKSKIFWYKTNKQLLIKHLQSNTSKTCLDSKLNTVNKTRTIFTECINCSNLQAILSQNPKRRNSISNFSSHRQKNHRISVSGQKNQHLIRSKCQHARI